MKCQVCGELQTSRYITYKDLPICEEHYKVFDLKRYITHKYITYKDLPICEEHYKVCCLNRYITHKCTALMIHL